MRRELEAKPYAAAFLRDAWHDLKTPVAALQATLEVLDDDAFDDPVAARRFLGNLRRSTDQLERALGDLVTLARFETASLRPDEAASMHDLVHDAVERSLPLAEATNVTLSAVPAPSSSPSSQREPGHTNDRLRCDPAAIVRALANLLDNAVGAAPGGSVEIAVDAAQRDVIVVDVMNGGAVPHDARKHLFERTPKSRVGRSSGLGLAMARAAVEAHEAPSGSSSSARRACTCGSSCRADQRPMTRFHTARRKASLAARSPERARRHAAVSSAEAAAARPIWPIS